MIEQIWIWPSNKPKPFYGFDLASFWSFCTCSISIRSYDCAGNRTLVAGSYDLFFHNTGSNHESWGSADLPDPVSHVGFCYFPKNPHRRTYLHLYHSLHSTHRVDGSVIWWRSAPLTPLPKFRDTGLVYGGSQSIFPIALYTNRNYSVLFQKATDFLGNRSPNQWKSMLSS